MKLIIDIPEERYKHIQEEQWLPNRLLIEKAIANGTPLDKVIEDIKKEIESYEADCILADDSKECKECDKVVFGTIYRIIEKHISGKETAEEGIITGLDIAINVIKSMDMKQGAEQDK